MEKTIFEQMGVTYTRQGDYYLTDLELPAEKENRPVGLWGQRHLRYLKEYHRITYTNLLASGKLNSYLADIDEQAEELFFRLVKQQMAEREGINETLKAEHPMEWAGKMNALREAAAEIVNAEVIFAQIKSVVTSTNEARNTFKRKIGG